MTFDSPYQSDYASTVTVRRWNQVFRFSGGNYRHDAAKGRRLPAARFQKSQLPPAQRRRLSKIEIISPDDVIFPEAKALCDFVYYGDHSGNGKAVDHLIATLQPRLRERVKDFRNSLAEIGKDRQPKSARSFLNICGV